jgi:hypothetical protein
MDDRSAQVVQAAIRRGGRSLLQYTGDSVPWTAPEDEPTLARLRQLIDEDQKAATLLGKLLRRQRQPVPYLGAYPEHFTTMNYLSLDRLLPLLVEDQRQNVAALEADLGAATDPEARTALREYLALKSRHLAAIEELHKTHSPVGVRV